MHAYEEGQKDNQPFYDKKNDTRCRQHGSQVDDISKMKHASNLNKVKRKLW